MDGNAKLVIATSLIGATAVLGAAVIQTTGRAADDRVPDAAPALAAGAPVDLAPGLGPLDPGTARGATDALAMGDVVELAPAFVDAAGRAYRIAQSGEQFAIRQFASADAAADDRVRLVGSGRLADARIVWTWQDDDRDEEECAGTVTAGGAAIEAACTSAERPRYTLRLVRA